jgi:hypothetical protein
MLWRKMKVAWNRSENHFTRIKNIKLLKKKFLINLIYLIFIQSELFGEASNVSSSFLPKKKGGRSLIR